MSFRKTKNWRQTVEAGKVFGNQKMFGNRLLVPKMLHLRYPRYDLLLPLCYSNFLDAASLVTEKTLNIFFRNCYCPLQRMHPFFWKLSFLFCFCNPLYKFFCVLYALIYMLLLLCFIRFFNFFYGIGFPVSIVLQWLFQKFSVDKVHGLLFLIIFFKGVC